MTIIGLKDLCGYWLTGLIGLWNTLNLTTYNVLYSVFGDGWEAVFQGLNAIMPNFAEYLKNDSLLMFMLSSGLTFYIAWAITTWLLNIVT